MPTHRWFRRPRSRRLWQSCKARPCNSPDPAPRQFNRHARGTGADLLALPSLRRWCIRPGRGEGIRGLPLVVRRDGHDGGLWRLRSGHNRWPSGGRGPDAPRSIVHHSAHDRPDAEDIRADENEFTHAEQQAIKADLAAIKKGLEIERWFEGHSSGRAYRRSFSACSRWPRRTGTISCAKNFMRSSSPFWAYAWKSSRSSRSPLICTSIKALANALPGGV